MPKFQNILAPVVPLQTTNDPNKPIARQLANSAANVLKNPPPQSTPSVPKPNEKKNPDASPAPEPASTPVVTLPQVDSTGFDFQSQEILSFKTAFGGVTPISNAMSINLPVPFVNRQIYGVLWASAVAPGNYYVKGEIRLLRNGAIMVRLPFSWGAGRPESLVSVLVGTATPVTDGISMYPATITLGEPANVALAPLNIRGSFDAMTFSVLESSNCDDAHIFMACKSY